MKSRLSQLPDPTLNTCLDAIANSDTPEALTQTAADLAEIRDANPGYDWRPVYRAYRLQENQIMRNE